jgi:hypothetical protein
MARDGRKPAHKVNGDWMFDYVEVFEHFVKQDIVASLNNILENPRLPREVHNDISGLANGLRDGLISMDQFTNAYESVSHA